MVCFGDGLFSRKAAAYSERVFYVMIAEKEAADWDDVILDWDFRVNQEKADAFNLLNCGIKIQINILFWRYL